MSDVTKDSDRIYARVDKKVAKYDPLSESDIDRLIQESRRKRRQE